ncbi:metallophosphoesterase [Paraburkholderia sediminicola]|uniref:metallophosphoesterase n=1 Tax=Paraburkholderia sediminicola TaxID=458836 RepID=UPI0038BD517F
MFVHLSDIHFGQEKMGGQRVVNEDARKQLIKDAAAVVSGLPSGRASGIIVTGDIAFAGKRHEYEAAGKWLDELALRVGCSAADIQMVPGNHDIDRDKIKGLTAMMLDAIYDEGEARLDSFLEDETSRDVLYHRFTEYRRFADAYQCPLDCAGQSSAERRVDLVEGRAIRFVRLNSALICTQGRNEHGSLLLGARQRVMTPADGEELVVLTHHPLNWYADSADATRFLRGRARVFISGHEHLAAVDVQNVEGGCDLMMLAAGATTPDKIDGAYTYAYNIIEFDWDEAEDALSVTLHPRAWCDEMKRFEADDVRLNGRDRRTVLGAPSFRKAPRPPKLEVIEGVTDTEQPHVEIILSQEQDVTAHEQVDESEYQNLYLRFFRDLPEGDRLRILVELDAVPGEIAGGFNHETEGRLFRTVARGNRIDELREKVETALARREQQSREE